MEIERVIFTEDEVNISFRCSRLELEKSEVLKTLLRGLDIPAY